MEIIRSLFYKGNFSPHGYCIAWNPLLVWASAIADGLIAAAYFSIPVVLVIFLLKRRDLVFPWIFALFGTFILLCGMTHVFGAVTLWVPLYGLETILKVLTAIVSVATAIALWPLIPRALALPSPAGMRAVNHELALEVGQRRQAESSLRGLNIKLQAQILERNLAEQRLTLAVEAVTHYAILMLDPAGRVTSWNAGAERIKGYKDNEIIGQHFSCFYTEESQADGEPQRVLDTAKSEGRFEGEGWRVRKDGSLFWASVVINAICTPGGELLGYGKVTRDLTERRQAQQALTDANLELEARVQERTQSLVALTGRLETEIQERKTAEETRREAAELLRATFDASPFPIIITGDKGNTLMFNKAGEATFGYTEAEVIAAGPGLLVPDGGEEAFDRIRTASRSGPMKVDLPVPHKDGRLLELRLSVTPILRADGTARATVTTIEDLTHKNLVEAQMRQSQKMEAIGTLTGGMAHDFNNLLGIIIGNLDLLRDGRPDDAELAELGGEALDAAMRGAELTRSLLAFARRQPLRPRRVDLDVVIGSLVKLLSRMLGEHVEITLNFAEDICGIVADPARLEATLTNLATNARDAMPRGGKLTIATSHKHLDTEYAATNPDVSPGDYAVIEITDTGEGMPPDIKSRIFEPFFTTKSERGTGLGLSMVFGFMKQSGGHISVYSEVGVGTTFRLYFPCSHIPEEGDIDLRSDSSLSGKGETILAVEDSIPLRRIVVRQLHGLGYTVLEAGNGAEALAILETETVDLLFTDVVMPGGIDGFELAASAVQRWPGIKVILTSGFPQTRFVDEIEPHAFPLLSKPYRKGNLAQLIRSVLDGREDTANS
jgi:PAS domain S-box-containing protein